MKKKLLCVLLALCFAFACQTAFAVSFSREEYRQIVFEAIGGASDANDKLCDNLWLGTVEAPGLGRAYLYTFVDVYEGKTQGFLYLYGDEAYLAVYGRAGPSALRRVRVAAGKLVHPFPERQAGPDAQRQ